jgi:hypothetical protein
MVAGIPVISGTAQALQATPGPSMAAISSTVLRRPATAGTATERRAAGTRPIHGSPPTRARYPFPDTPASAVWSETRRGWIRDSPPIVV